MVYVRAIQKDIENWNLDGWSWKKVYETFISLESFQINDATELVPEFHGTSGLIATSRATYIDKVAPEFISSAIQAGITFTNDFNDPNGRTGVGYYHFNIVGGTRSSVARAMLSPIMNNKRENFVLELEAEVTKVILESKLPHDKIDKSSPVNSKSIRYHHANTQSSHTVFNQYSSTEDSITENKINNSFKYLNFFVNGFKVIIKSVLRNCNLAFLTTSASDEEEEYKQDVKQGKVMNNRTLSNDLNSLGVSDNEFVLSHRDNIPSSSPITSPTFRVSGTNHYKATGVTYMQNGVLKTAYLRSTATVSMRIASGKHETEFSAVRSVILSAGAIMTPKLLMNSGIGRRDILKSAGVEVIVVY